MDEVGERGTDEWPTKFIGLERAAVVHKHVTAQLCRKRFEAGGGIASGVLASGRAARIASS